VTASDTSERRALERATAGRYVLERELGRGGMAIVYLAREVALERQVALKALPTAALNAPDVRERFVREARIAASLSHPNIVPIHTVEAHETAVFFSMAYVQGETLTERVRRTGRLPVDEVVRLARDVAWALGYAHDHGVIHRDVKPDNIILERDTGRALMADFGIAHSLEAHSIASPGELLGTPHFMSPEQAVGAPVDGRSDLYSLGATLFFAATGQKPFEADTLREIISRHILTPAPPALSTRPDLPPRLAQAIDRCLAKDPTDRFPTAAAFGEHVAAAQDAVVDVPERLRAFRAAADSTLMDAAGAALLLLFVVTARTRFDYFGWDASARATIVALALALVAGTLAQLVHQARRLLLARYSREDIQAAFTQRNLMSSADGPSRPVGEALLVHEASMAALVLCVYWWAGGRDAVSKWIPSPWSWGFEVMGLVLPVFAGRAIASLVLDLSGPYRWWNRAWAGWLGRVVLALASYKVPRRATATRGADATEIILGDAAGQVFDTLPTAMRKRFAEVPHLLDDVGRQAGALRVRLLDLERARALIGQPTPSRSEALSSGEQRRARATEELDGAAETMRRRLAIRVAALDSLRIELLRLQTGTGTPAEFEAAVRRTAALRDTDEPSPPGAAQPPYSSS
jgi:serine/threonine-protein kinase